MPIVAGPPAFITISNIRWTATNAAFTVLFDTDQPILMAMDYWSHNDPSIPPGTAGSVLEGVARTAHTITTNALPAGNHAGYVFGFSLRMDTNDVQGKLVRPYQGWIQLPGARVQQAKSVPVRWNMFGDGTRPANGGGTTNLGQGPAAGNWSSYTWAQYNPKGTTFPTP